MAKASLIGSVQDVDGPSISVALGPDVPTGLIFVDGEPYRVGQVGSFARIPVGYADLVGVVTRVGAGATPSSEIENSAGSRWLTLELIGEAARGQNFVRGVSQLPNIDDGVHVVTGSDLASIYGSGSGAPGYVEIGSVAASESIGARLNLNQLVTRHSAVVGSTGSGKSTTVASLIQAMANDADYPSARVVLFDMHGEYARAFGNEANIFTLNPETVANSSQLAIPFWALTFEELVPLLFGTLTDDAGRAFIRDEIVRLKRAGLIGQPIAGIAEVEVTADSPVPFSLKQLWFDLHVLLNATHTTAGGQSMSTWALQLDAADQPIEPGSAESIVSPLFKAQTQAAGSEKVYLSTTPMNFRRQVDVLGSRLRDRRFDFLLDPGDWAPSLDAVITKDLDDLLQGWLAGDHAVTVVDLSGVPPLVANDVVGSMTRVIYDAMFWARKLSEGSRERPLLFVFEEAHSYLGSAGGATAKLAVQRIVREGRKYGMGAMIVSQRPSEIDTTILSQCGTLIAMRLSNSTDRQHIAAAAADNMRSILAMLPILRTGEAIIVGESVPLPMRALINLPRSRPDSQDPSVVGNEIPGGWDRPREPSDYSEVARVWRSQNPNSEKLIPPS